jgi:hypothetical protein
MNSSFININETDFQLNTIVWNAQEVGKVGAMLEITLIPTVDVELIPASTLYKFAQLMRHVNSLYGTPVLLRFMHEMNGTSSLNAKINSKLISIYYRKLVVSLWNASDRVQTSIYYNDFLCSSAH